jgi:hypothetical protein
VNNTRAFRVEPTAGTPNLIGGFNGNNVTAGATGATIGGGGTTAFVNRATDDYGTVGGGYDNQAGDGLGLTTDAKYATVGGGQSNTASGITSTVAGGQSNTASATLSMIGGGWFNTASGGGWSTVGGGAHNLASGGGWSTVGGGHNNTASASNSTVGGGGSNTASGNSSTVPGGNNNTASGGSSFAAGSGANAAHDGAFVWSDTTAVTASTGINQFIARASGGFTFFTDNGTAGATLAAGSSAWATISDRHSKDNVVRMNGRETLEKLGAIPISSWNYKTQDASIRHIGPMAQDFYAAFKVGEDDKHITTIDAEGVALSAIQGLHSVLKEKEEEVRDLKARVVTLEARLEAIEKALGK